MNATLQEPGFADVVDARTLVLRRRLPGPIERVWSYLTDSELRRQWLAAGEMATQPDTDFELVWRNDTLSASAAERPEGFGAESRATCRLAEIDPPHRLAFTWPDVGDVSIALRTDGNEVLLELTHRGVPDRAMALMVGAGWHAHLDILVARVGGTVAPSFWSSWLALRRAYEGRIPA